MPTSNPFNKGYYYTDELKQMGFKKVGTDVAVAKCCNIIGLENITIGNNVRIDFGVTISASFGHLTIGNYIHIGGYSFIACSGGVELGDYSGLSQGVKIYSTSDDYSGEFLTNPTIPKKLLRVKTELVKIHKHAIIGSNSVILPGVEIGVGAAVGALSFVSKSLESWGIYAGIPAKKLCERKQNLLKLEYLLKNKM